MSYSIPRRILESAFLLMSDVTRHTPGEGTIDWYCDEWGKQHLQPASIVDAVRDLMGSWDSGRWPGPDVIAVRAKQIMRDAEDVLAGQTIAKNRLEDLCEIAAQQRWEDRRARARAWVAQHRDLLPAIEAEVDAHGRKQVDQFGLRDDLVRRMGDAFREGALVSLCLELERIEHTPVGRERIVVMRDQARVNTGEIVAA